MSCKVWTDHRPSHHVTVTPQPLSFLCFSLILTICSASPSNAGGNTRMLGEWVRRRGFVYLKFPWSGNKNIRHLTFASSSELTCLLCMYGWFPVSSYKYKPPPFVVGFVLSKYIAWLIPLLQIQTLRQLILAGVISEAGSNRLVVG